MNKKFCSLLLVAFLLCSCCFSTFTYGTFDLEAKQMSDVEKTREANDEKESLTLQLENQPIQGVHKELSYCELGQAITGTVLNKYNAEINESFFVEVSVNNAQIDSFTYETEGFSVVSQVEQNNNKILVSLKATGNVEKPVFLLHINLQDGSTVTPHVYGFVYENKVFLSKSSYDDAWKGYLEYLKTEEIITEEQADEMQNEQELEGVIEETYSEEGTAPLTRASANTWVKGRLQWKDDNGVLHPLQHVAIDVFDDDVVFEDHLGETYTDENGYYSLGFENQTISTENGGCDPYIKVYCMDNELNVVVDEKVSNGYDVESSHVNGDVATGSTTTINMTFTMDNDLGRAFQILQAAVTMTRYIKAIDNSNKDLGLVRIRYPDSGDRCYYQANRIYITGEPAEDGLLESYASWDVIAHEYGHHVQQLFDVTDNPGGGHWVNRSMIEHYAGTDHSECDCVQPGAAQAKYEGIRLAWGESWNTVLGIRSQQYFSNILQNIETVGDAAYTSYNGVDYNLETGLDYSSQGEGCEATVAYALYDICDPANETSDTINLGDRQFFNVTTASKAKTFSDYINYCVTNNKINAIALGNLLSHHRIAPFNFRVTTSISLTPPTFKWEPGNNTIERNYLNNKFVVVFFDSNNKEILRSNEITSTTFAPSQSQWDMILASNGTKIKAAVYGYQTSSPITGPYLSNVVEYEKPEVDPLSESISVASNAKYLEKVVSLQPGQYIDYNITFAKAGNKLLQTFGPKDAYMYLYDANGNLIDSDDDSGYSTNAMISYTFSANTSYKVRVKFYSSVTGGQIKFGIIPIYSKIDSYESIGLSNMGSMTAGGTLAGSVSLQRYSINQSKAGGYVFETDRGSDTGSYSDMYLYLIDPTSTEPCLYNDDGAGNSQARITTMMEPNIQYLLLTTTYDINKTGSFRLYTKFNNSVISSIERTIEDVGDMKNPYCSKAYDSLIGYSIPKLKEKNYKTLTLTITMDVKEVNDGYQYIALYDGTSTSAKQFGYQKFEHGAGKKDTSYWSHTFTFTINLNEITSSSLCIRFNASGVGSDTWNCKNVKLSYTVGK